MRWLLIIFFLLPSIVFAETVTKVITPALNIVQIDLKDPNISIQVVSARKGPCSVESFGSMVKRIQPVAAINGGFFCLRTLRPTGDVRTKSVYRRGYYGDDLLVNGNKVSFLPRQLARQCKGDLVGLGPRLLRNGKIAVNPVNEGFRGSVHFGSHIRTAIAITKSNKLLFVTSRYSMYLGTLAKHLQEYGCRAAYGLDGGSSTGLFYKGRFIAGPGRSIVNFVVAVVLKPQSTLLQALLGSTTPTSFGSAYPPVSAVESHLGLFGLPLGFGNGGNYPLFGIQSLY